nr:autotransporter domain-containing protein [uncultured Brevundimonas sp.]
MTSRLSPAAPAFHKLAARAGIPVAMPAALLLMTAVTATAAAAPPTVPANAPGAYAAAVLPSNPEENAFKAILPENSRAMSDSAVTAIQQRLNQARRGGGGRATLGAGAGDVVLWGGGNHRNLSGSDGALNWDGLLTGVHVGADVDLGSNVTTGLSFSWMEGAVDNNTAGSDYDLKILAAHPYIGWRMGEVDLWAAGGYGSGTLDVVSANRIMTSNTINLRTIGVGGNGDLWGTDVANLRIKTEFLSTAMDVDRPGKGPDLTLDATRVRVTMEAGHLYRLSGGGQFRQSLAVGVRIDDGDGRGGSGAEIGAGLRYTQSRLTIALQGRTILEHTGGYEEWGVHGSLRLTPVNGRGLSFTVSPGYGAAATGVEQLWQQGIPAATGTPAAARSRARLNTRLGYGLPLPILGGLLTPYSEYTMGDTVRYSLGMNWQPGALLNLTLSGERRIPTRQIPTNNIQIRGALNF